MRALCRIRLEPHYRRAAFENGLKRVGFTLLDAFKPAGPEDWFVIWNRQGSAEIEADDWERRGGTVIVAENGYLQKVDKTYYAISAHGHNGSGWYPVDEDEDRFAKLGFPMREWKSNEGGHWLVCGQRGIGSREMKSPVGWGEKMTQKLRAHGYEVRFRPHPGNFAPKVPLEYDLKGAHTCVIWSSASGVRALVEGVSVRHSAPHWVCDGANEITRAAVLNDMAHGQWHHNEITTGEPFARIIAQRSKAVW